MKFNMFAFCFSVLALSISAPSASAGTTSTFDINGNSMDQALLQSLASRALECTHQPFAIKATGNKTLGRVRSHCEDVRISENTVAIRLPSGNYSVTVRDNVNTDGGDLNDVYVSFEAQKNQEELLQESVLAFSDPVVALLLLAGHSPEAIVQIEDSSLLR
jgi:hypothetical protein